MLDQIILNKIRCQCIIGTLEWERKQKQEVLIDVILFADLKEASLSDKITDTVDYKIIEEKITHHVANSNYFLLEKLAGSISEICLNYDKIKEVKVKTTKTGTLDLAKEVSIEIFRQKT